MWYIRPYQVSFILGHRSGLVPDCEFHFSTDHDSALLVRMMVERNHCSFIHIQQGDHQIFPIRRFDSNARRDFVYRYFVPVDEQANLDE